MLLYQTLAFAIHGKIFWKNHTKIINLKYQLRHWLRSLNYLMDHILYHIIKITSNISLKNMEKREAELFTPSSLLFARCLLLFACCSLLFGCCSLLFACCLLVIVCYLLLFAHYSLLFARCFLLFTRCLLRFASRSLLFARCSLRFTDVSLRVFEILVTVSGWWLSKFFEHAKPFSNLTWSHKYCLNWYHFDVFIKISGHILIYSYILEESEVVAWKSSMKREFLNIPQNSQENICAGFSFCNKTAGWQSVTSLNTESCTCAFLWVF